LIERPVFFTATARGQIERERGWWQENRDHQEAFAVDLEGAVEVLKILPGVGTLYVAAGLPGLRRLYLRRIGCHIYYTFDDKQVIVRALWGVRRRQGPDVR